MSLARPARSLRVRRRARPVRAEVAFPSSRHSGATFGGWSSRSLHALTSNLWTKRIIPTY